MIYKITLTVYILIAHYNVLDDRQLKEKKTYYIQTQNPHNYYLVRDKLSICYIYLYLDGSGAIIFYL